MAKKKEVKQEKKADKSKDGVVVAKVKNRMIYNGHTYEKGDEIKLSKDEALRLMALLDVKFEDTVIQKG